MNRTSYRMRLSAAIVEKHGVLAQWITSTTVTERVKGKTAWHCEVETFELVKHPKARHCYAWAIDVGGNTEIMMALKIPPIGSPAAAVREYLTSANTKK